MGFLTDLSAAAAWAPEDLLWLHDDSAVAGSKSKKTTLAGLFGNVPSPIGVRPTTGFATGQGGDLLCFDVSAANADAPPFRISCSAYEMDGGAEPDNAGYRIGIGFKDEANAVIEDGFNHCSYLGFEPSFFEAGGHNGEFYHEVRWRTDPGGDPEATGSVRPLFSKWDIAAPLTTLTTTLTGYQIGFSDVAAGLVFRYLDGAGRMMTPDGKALTLRGTTLSEGSATAGEIQIAAYSSSNRNMFVGFVGGADEIFQIVGAGAAANLPDRMTVGIDQNVSPINWRRNPTGGFVAIGLGVMPAAPSSAGQIHLGEAFNLHLGTATGTKIGTAAGQKLAFHGATPVAQHALPTSVDAGAVNSGDATTDGVIENLRTIVTELRTMAIDKGLTAAA